MTNERLRAQCEAEFENIQAVLDELFVVVRPEKADYSVAEMAAVATFLHNAYNGIENVLKRIHAAGGTEPKSRATWHKELLKASADIGIIPHDLYEILSNYLSFRHFFVHAYSFSLKWEELKPLVDGIQPTMSYFRAAVYEYLAKLR